MPPKFCILLWKDLMHRRHKPFYTFLELITLIGLTLWGSSVPHTMDRDTFGMGKVFIPIPFFGPDQFQKPFSETWEKSVILLHEPDNPFLNSFMQEIKYGLGILTRPHMPIEPDYPHPDSFMQESTSRRRIMGRSLPDDGGYSSTEKRGEKLTVTVKFHGMDSHQTEIPKFLNYTLYPDEKIDLDIYNLHDFGLAYYQDVHMLWRKCGSSSSINFYTQLIDVTGSTFVCVKNISFRTYQLRQGFDREELETTQYLYLRFYIMSILMYFMTSIILPIKVIQEKNSGAKELLLIMGIKRWQIWLAKLVDGLIPLIINNMAVVMLIAITGIVAASPLHFVLLFIIANISIIIFLFFLSCILTSVFAAFIITSLIYPVAYFLQNVLLESASSRSVFIAKCLLPQVCLEDALYTIVTFDYFDKNVDYLEVASARDKLSLLGSLGMLTFDIFLYSVLTLYLELVLPSKFGVRKPFYFFLMKSYWFPKKTPLQIDESTTAQDKTAFEDVPSHYEKGITIEGVSKTYKQQRKNPVVAVDNVSVGFYKGELTGLLGHNGAGKTTLISIICGLTPASSGRVLVDNYDVAINTEKARKSLGFCQQHDMLFENLSALSNVAFFGMIKGLSKRDAFEDAKNSLEKLKMLDAKDTLAGNLSGGQKRKVSLARALCGNSEVLILDEPTSGLDPEIRREVWDMLLKIRGSKTIILTTHFMEEADALCDRIAMMDKGKIKIFGTPMFLKSKFGTGYTLAVVMSDTGKVDEISELVKKLIKGSFFKSKLGLTMYYQLPEIEISNFSSLFEALDKKRSERVILTYSINTSSLEDVFLSVSSGQPGIAEPEDSEGQSLKKCPISLIYIYQLGALLIKKLLHTKNYVLRYIFLNVIFIGMAALFLFVNADTFQVRQTLIYFPLTLSIYGGKQEILLLSNKEDELANVFIRVVEKSGGKINRIEAKDLNTGIEELFQNDYHRYKNTFFGIQFLSNNITLATNIDAVHSLAIATNLIYNSHLESQNQGWITTNVDLQRKRETLECWPNDFPTYKPLSSCAVDFMLLWPTIISFYYLLLPLEEDYHGVKHLQLMTTPWIIYWISHLIIDFFTFLFPVVIIAILYGASNEEAYDLLTRNWENEVSLWILWIVALLLFQYATSTICKSLLSAFFNFISLYFFALVLQLIYTIHPKDYIPAYMSWYHPSFILANYFTSKCGEYFQSKPLTVKGTLLALALNAASFTFFIFLKESKTLALLRRLWCCRPKYQLEHRRDTLVEKEEETVQKLRKEKDLRSKALTVLNLKRWFCRRCKKFPAVRGITFSVNEGECFGLLGTNGAGKTSTFNMLTGKQLPSSGRAYAHGSSLFNCITRSCALHKIAFCPQNGGFIPNFRVNEMLYLFARLRGIPPSFIKKEVKSWIERVNLQAFENKKCGNLSGGNQRKLSLALSLIGDSRLVFLDEPTTGVDPGARRYVWNQISNLREKGQSVVLTSHSMDECEALCTRLTIMVKGQLCCLGETVLLKEKFGGGYSVLIKTSIGTKDEDKQKLKDEMVRMFDPGCNLTDDHGTMMHYHITNPAVSWKDLFVKLSDAKKKFKFLESFSASATTLEELFMHFARSNQRQMGIASHQRQSAASVINQPNKFEEFPELK